MRSRERIASMYGTAPKYGRGQLARMSAAMLERERSGVRVLLGMGWFYLFLALVLSDYAEGRDAPNPRQHRAVRVDVDGAGRARPVAEAAVGAGDAVRLVHALQFAEHRLGDAGRRSGEDAEVAPAARGRLGCLGRGVHRGHQEREVVVAVGPGVAPPVCVPGVDRVRGAGALDVEEVRPDPGGHSHRVAVRADAERYARLEGGYYGLRAVSAGVRAPVPCVVDALRRLSDVHVAAAPQ